MEHWCRRPRSFGRAFKHTSLTKADLAKGECGRSCSVRAIQIHSKFYEAYANSFSSPILRISASDMAVPEHEESGVSVEDVEKVLDPSTMLGQALGACNTYTPNGAYHERVFTWLRACTAHAYETLHKKHTNTSICEQASAFAIIKSGRTHSHTHRYIE